MHARPTQKEGRLTIFDQELHRDFIPCINHNLDDKLRDWANGVSAFDRLYGEALCRHETRKQRETNGCELAARAATNTADDEETIDLLYEYALSEVNGETYSKSSSAAFSGRYLEQTRHFKPKLLEEASAQLLGECTFTPAVSKRAPARTVCASPSSTVTTRLRESLAKTKNQKTTECTSLNVLANAEYIGRRNEVLLNRLERGPCPEKHTGLPPSKTFCSARIAAHSRLLSSTLCRDNRFINEGAKQQQQAGCAAFRALLSSRRLSFENLKSVEQPLYE